MPAKKGKNIDLNASGAVSLGARWALANLRGPSVSDMWVTDSDESSGNSSV